MRRTLFLTGLLLLSSIVLFAQSTITGKVTDTKTGIPISGVSVRIKSTKKGTTTNNEGVFKLLASSNDILEITIVGYKSQTVNVNGLSEITVGLEQGSTELNEVVVTGSRGAPRVRTESPVPIDVIKVNQIGETSAKPDLMSQLNMTVPSFNYNKQSGGDGSDAIDFASLRGLGFDQTLVLVNGKRRHLSAFVNQVGTRGRGNSGTDLNAIPEASIDRIEILRDGASAQYGSDAIAGVINIILKKDINHLNFSTGVSGFYDHKYNTLNNVDPTQYYTGSQIDGKTLTFGVDYGLPIGKNGGFINFGGNFYAQGKTFRAVPDTNWSSNPKALGVDDWRRAAGDGSVVSGGGMFNAEIPIAGTKTTFYSFGGYNYKHSNVYAWTRRWHKESNRAKFPTDLNGNLIFVPGIMRVFDPTPGQLDTNNVYYNPQEDVYIKDESIALGLRGTLGNWDWDFSNNIGYNDFHYFGNKTFNASLMPYTEQATKTRFDDGGFSFLQNTANLDVTRHFKNVAAGLTVSFGGELRYEKYKLYAGEVGSYSQGGGYFVQNGDTTYKNSGSEGYPGYQPSDAVVANRTNVGGYIDLTLDVTKDWVLDGAARFENYSDFGFVNTYKLATHYKVTSNFNLRGSISTGFRAPSLQQINFSNTNTNIVSGNLVYVKAVPNYSIIARAAGIPYLKPEKSVNASLGFTWKPINSLTFSVDGYLIKLKDRIVYTGQFYSDVTAIAPYLTQFDVSAVQFFANAVNTTNKGIDIVADYTKSWGKEKFKAVLAGNIQWISIDAINVPTPLNDTYIHQQEFFSDREKAFLIASAPKSKFSLSLEYSLNKFAVGSHITYFGKSTTLGFGEDVVPGADPDGPGGSNTLGLGAAPYVRTDDGKSVIPEAFVFNGKVTTDLYVSYKLNKHIAWILGVDNIFNVHPDIAATKGALYDSWGDSESGGAFDAVQMGSNGRRLFTKLVFNF